MALTNAEKQKRWRDRRRALARQEQEHKARVAKVTSYVTAAVTAKRYSKPMRPQSMPERIGSRICLVLSRHMLTHERSLHRTRTLHTGSSKMKSITSVRRIGWR